MLAAILFFQDMCGVCVFTSSMVMVNSAAPRSKIGEVNGAGQTCASLVRAVGPALGGTLWGAATSLGVNGQQSIPFLLISVGLILAQIIYQALPKDFCARSEPKPQQAAD